ncbi:DoxX family protein [Pseudomonas sp. Pseusp16]|uniref:DoxX family protein n=1 Tax=Pseudomonas sp. Pseusp16 TaxID=3243021 RepID=UPI0039B3CC6B
MIENYIYWISTTLLSLLYLASATMYLVKRDWVRQAFADLGYPAYLVPILIAVKILAVAAILLRINVPLSDLAYAGMLYHLLLSALAHINVRKPRGALPAAICLVLLVASFFTQNAARDVSSPYGQVITAHQETPR